MGGAFSMPIFSFLSAEISGTQMPNGNILGITQDLTEQVQSEAALRHCNQRLTMLRQIDQGLVSAQLWVRDNGVGFEMKYHDQILDIFQRLRPAEAYGGTGIGLAIVNKAMERLGGRVWAESEPDRGATFFLEILTCVGPVSWAPTPTL